jgi:hypothetical protein
MQSQPRRRQVSGHIYWVERAKGPVWYWKVRLPDGRDERLVIGPEWTGSGRPPSGYFTKRTAKAALDARLTDLRRGIGVPAQTGATFRDAAEEWFSRGKVEKGWKPSTIRDYRSALDKHLLPHFGPMSIESITAAKIEDWRSERMADDEDPLPLRTAVKLLAMTHGVYERARKTYGLKGNPAEEVERLRVKYAPEEYDFYSLHRCRHSLRSSPTNPPWRAATRLRGSGSSDRLGRPRHVVRRVRRGRTLRAWLRCRAGTGCLSSRDDGRRVGCREEAQRLNWL